MPSRKNRSVARSAKLRIICHYVIRNTYQSRGVSARWVDSSPPPVQPQPLLRVLAHPALDHAGDQLHSALEIHFALGVTWQVERLGHLALEMIAISKPHDADTAHEATRVAGNLG